MCRPAARRLRGAPPRGPGPAAGKNVTSFTPRPLDAGDGAAENRWLFIYYRVASKDAAAAAEAVQRLQCRLRQAWPDLQAQWLKRPDEKDGMQTWMEIYCSPGGITAAVQAHIEREAQALAPWCHGPRHVEVFVPCVS